MLADPYFCRICDLTFKSEKESYEHDVSLLHHEKYDKEQKTLHLKARHFCSICDIGGMCNMASWISHTSGKRHQKCLKSFREFYSPDTTFVKQSTVLQLEKKSQKRSTSLMHQSNPKLPAYRPSTVRRVCGNHRDYRTSKGQSSYSRSNAPHSSTNFSRNDGRPTFTAEVSTKSDDHDTSRSVEVPVKIQSGLMQNILETVTLETSDSKSTNPTEPMPRNHKKLSDGVPLSTMKHSKSVSINGSRRSTSLKRVDRDGSGKPVVKRPRGCLLPTPSEIIPIVCDSDAAETADVSDLKCMHEALEISRQLESLNKEHASLEQELHRVQGRLIEVKTQKRSLKLRRTVLLRGLTCSESDEDADRTHGQSVTEASSLCASDRLTLERQVASVAPVNVPSRPGEMSDPVPNAETIVISSPSLTSSGSLSSVYPFPTISSHLQPTQQLRVVSTASCVSQDSPSLPSQVQCSSTGDQLPIHHSLPKSVGLDTHSGAVDFERLALIRQALQSPDSWQFTFEDVDRMLQRTAARAAVAATIAAAEKADHVIRPDASVSVALSNKNNDIPTVRVPVTEPFPVSVTTTSTRPFKGEPTVLDSSVKCNKPPDPIPLKNSSVKLSVSHAVRSASNEPSSSDEENSTPSRTMSAHKIHRMIKVDPGCLTTPQSEICSSVHISDRVDSDSESSDSHVLKNRVKYGEFHAFDGGTAAVIDMALHLGSCSVLIGGQNGVVSQYSLQSFQFQKRFADRDASVTRLVLDMEGTFLFVGYYDNYFAQYNVQSGVFIHEKYFSSRIEALAAPPCRDVPFIYFGMSNGDILRHHRSDFTTSALYQSCPPSDGGISSMATVRSGSRILLLIGERDTSLHIRDAFDGSLIRTVTSAPHKGPPQGITILPQGSNFCAYSERTLRIHNWKTGVGILTVQTQTITSCCVARPYVAIGDSEGSIRVYKLQADGLPASRPIKVYYATTRAAITSLISCGVALISGSLDGTVTVVRISEPASNYVCLYGPFGHNCGIGFDRRKDLIAHVMNTHLIFGNQKSVMCRWGGGRCRTRFTDTQSMKAISDHLLTHMPD